MFYHEPISQPSTQPRQSLTNPELSELLLIQQQGDLINELMMKSYNISSKKCHTFSTEISELSFDSVEKSRHLNTSISAISLCREYSKYFEEEGLEEVMDQIRRCCSRRTYNFIRNKLRTSMESKRQAQLQKELKLNQQLTQRCLKLTQQVAELKVKLQSTNQKLVAQQKKKHIRTESSIDRSQIFLKWQKSMLYKERIQNEMKKNLNKQFQMLEEQRKENQGIREDIASMLGQIEGEGEQEGVGKLLEEIRGNVQRQAKMDKIRQEDYYKMQDNIQGIVKQLKEAIRNLD